MQQERHHVEESELWGWLRFLRNLPLHKGESPFALWHSVDEVVEDKRNSVYQAKVGVQGFERARHAIVEKTWPRFY